MPSLSTGNRRRRVPDPESSDEGDDSPASTDPRVSGASKRARTGQDTSQLSDDDLDQSAMNGIALRQNGKGHSQDGFQPGAITRVKVNNFVTYEDAVFNPGPNLNMVIGPNGTGKSSLVCAICIGLGYGAANLGRAAKFSEFVKHGKDQATIEIELQRKPEDRSNYIIKVRITREGDKRKWWINGSEVPLKNVQQLVRGLGIQVDNLCQFLPQDRVSEFSGLSPVALLHETQRAAAPPEMLTWHDELKVLRKNQKGIQLNLETDEETLRTQEERQEGLRGDVERLQERAQIQDRVALLESSVPFVDYNVKRRHYIECRERAREAKNQVVALEAEFAPTVQAVNNKEEYYRRIDVAVKERKKDLLNSERAADNFFAQVEVANEGIKELEQKAKSERDGEQKRKQQHAVIKEKIAALEAQLKNEPPAFDGPEWNAKIRAEEHKCREIEAEQRQVTEKREDLDRQGLDVKARVGEKERELATLNSQQGKNISLLRSISRDAATAWEWIQANRNKFEKDVFGPPLIECRVKDPRYANAIESLFQKNDFMVITAQTSADFKILDEHLLGASNLRLADINLRTVSRSLGQVRNSPMPTHELEKLGLDGWALDYVDGPEPVLSMLCGAVRLDRIAVGLKDLNESQYNALTSSAVATFVTGRSHYSVQRRREYGPGATSTTTKSIQNARYWTGQPIDTNDKHELEETLKALRENFGVMKVESGVLKEKLRALSEQRSTILETIKILKAKKNEAQLIAGRFQALPGKIEREKENFQAMKLVSDNYRARMREVEAQTDELVLKKNTLSIEYKALVQGIRTAHLSLQEAKFRLIEAASDVESLKEHSSDITRRVQQERQNYERANEEYKNVKAQAIAVHNQCISILAEGNNKEYFETIDKDLTIEQLEQDIDAEKSKLDYIHDGNPGALREFESRQVTIDRLTTTITSARAELTSVDHSIATLRARWEPELDKLIASISAAFAHNFEQIGCAGEVGVHKDEDFDLWAIEIRVKFRENETLQQLDQHRQSGGERSVSTIFYLMALQSLARSPFRVVDEINQGMDPRNERMVHERMVDIACREHTSQYFLITPKLLTGLRYDRRMKVLCIASGEHMPRDHRTLDIRSVIASRRAIMMPVM
ncbi:structural maintenance of chromosomes protein [Pseudogymnoascus destructans]|uniref:Structural maintenance of chromosomes protein 5 n=2 Tax=Pseudogymnoascus destructans TaxID=655981 RepID=L8FSC7_PSED2|nr:structural maintenance of chromosomes protein [Pseudogymnoascus destructans]ELR03474.1 hypothetical protein GMDG_06204 [Pseudogymnoascus destructans 20631-21]OAF63048.1 structural maintenance of chromosomes protein [Pseudogymnoascus destructans]